MDQSAAWLKPCGVRVWGTTVTFYTSSLLLIILFPSPPTPILSFHLEIPVSVFPLAWWHFMFVWCLNVNACMRQKGRGDLILCVMVSGSISQ